MVSQAWNFGWRFWARWLIASVIGWVIGIILAIVLSYAVVNLFYDKTTNLIVGLVLGAGVGLAQMIAVRKVMPLTWRWVWGAAIGLGVPFIVAVVIDEVWFAEVETIEAGFVIVGAAGGALAGLLQKRALRPHTHRTEWWILASTVSWSLAWLGNIVLGEAGIAVGGVILGAVSGALLIWIVNRGKIPIL